MNYLEHKSKMTMCAYYLKWMVMDQFEFKRFTFDHEAQAQAFKEKIWSDLSAYQAISFQTEAVHLAQKKLCVFDMDSTLINQEAIDEIARLFGFYDEVSKTTERAMQGKLDFTQALQERCKHFIGLPESRLQEILPKLSLSRGARELILRLQSMNIKTAVVSGGFEFVLKHFQSELKIDQIHAHTLAWDLNRNFSGSIQGPVIDAHQKRTLTVQMKQEYGVTTEQTITVGDGANDIEMMKEAGISVSFCGKPKLTAVANTVILERNLALLEKLL